MAVRPQRDGNIFQRIGGGDKGMPLNQSSYQGGQKLQMQQQQPDPLMSAGTDIAKGAAVKYGLPAAKSALGGIFGGGAAAGGAASVAGTGAAGAGGATLAGMGAGATTAIAPVAAGAAGAAGGAGAAGTGMLAAMGPVGWGILGAGALALGGKKMGWF